MARRRPNSSPHRPLRVRPSLGGKLMASESSDSVGAQNFVVNRDWRRVRDRYVRAEGYEYFWPNVTLPLGSQPFPNAPSTTEPITLLVQAIEPNGKLAVVAGTPTKLYRYYALDNGAYAAGEGTPAAYDAPTGPDTPYFDNNPGVWLLIGSGFSPMAQRWECGNINGYLVLNNGVDLPMTYRVQDDRVYPIWEMRESGIASVGNITVFNTVLFCADVSQISATALTSIMTPVSSGTVTAGQVGSYFSPPGVYAQLVANVVYATGAAPFTGDMVGWTIQFGNGQSRTITVYSTPSQVFVNGDGISAPPVGFALVQPGMTDFTVTASADFFDPGMVGREMFWADGTTRTIVTYLSPTQVITDSNLGITASVFSLNNPAAYAPYTDQNNIDRFQYRIANSAQDNPRRWNASAPCSISQGSTSLVLDYPAKSFATGQQVLVLGAGVLGGNLLANILNIAPDGMHITLDTPAQTTVTGALVEQADAQGSLVGYTDLQDDGSGIVAMLPLDGYLVVYKTTAIFIGQWSGANGDALSFGSLPPYHGDKTLFYRYTLSTVNIEGRQYHIYAGRGSFYRLDVVLQKPAEITLLEECKSLFFDNVDLPGVVGANLIASGTVYNGPSHSPNILVAVQPGQSYYVTLGANDYSFQNGRTTIYQSGQIIAVGGTVLISGTAAGSLCTASLTVLNNIGVFTADNALTKEIFFCFPTAQGPDKALRYDYFNGVATTTSAAYTAAALVKRPVAGLQVGPSEDWFIMGTATGTVVRYGYTSTKPFYNIGTVTQSGNTLTSIGGVSGAELFTPESVTGRTIQFSDLSCVNVTGFISGTQITVGGPPMTRQATSISVLPYSWHRLGQPYDSVRQSGLECMQNSFGEKSLEKYLLLLASDSPGSAVNFEVLGAVNPSDTPPTLGSLLITAPLAHNAIPLGFMTNYFADRLTVSGVNNPCEIIENVWNVATLNTEAAVQSLP